MPFERTANEDQGEWGDDDQPRDNPDGCPFVAAWLMARVGAVVFVISWMLRRNKRER